MLVGNHICWTTCKEPRCKKYLKVICLTTSSHFVRHSTIKSGEIRVSYHSRPAIQKNCRGRKGGFIALVSEKRYSNRNQHWALRLRLTSLPPYFTQGKVTWGIFEGCMSLRRVWLALSTSAHVSLYSWNNLFIFQGTCCKYENKWMPISSDQSGA